MWNVFASDCPAQRDNVAQNLKKGKLVPLLNQTPRHKDMWEMEV